MSKNVFIIHSITTSKPRCYLVKIAELAIEEEDEREDWYGGGLQEELLKERANDKMVSKTGKY